MSYQTKIENRKEIQKKHYERTKTETVKLEQERREHCKIKDSILKVSLRDQQRKERIKTDIIQNLNDFYKRDSEKKEANRNAKISRKRESEYLHSQYRKQEVQKKQANVQIQKRMASDLQSQIYEKRIDQLFQSAGSQN